MTGTSDVRDTADAVLAGRGGTGHSDPRALRDLVVELGWPLVSIDPEQGGAGGDLNDLIDLVMAVGFSGAEVPLVEWSTCAWLRAKTALPGDLLTPTLVGPTRTTDQVSRGADGTLTGRLHHLAGSNTPAAIMICAGATLDESVIVDTASPGVSLIQHDNLAGEARFDVHLDGATAQGLGSGVPTWSEVSERQSLLRLAATVGALDRAVALTVDHVRVREQFGRPLAHLPVVQDRAAGMVIAQSAASNALALAAQDVTQLDAAAVVIRESADTAAELAHQLLGAIGTTHEHDLHRLTTRIWAWRDDVPTIDAAQRLGAAVLTQGHSAWELTTMA